MKKLSIRTAAAAHGVPKSTLYVYAKGRIEVGSRSGPDTVLTAAEEEKIVEYIVHMSKIGYGRTKENVSRIVQKILVEEGRPKPFKDNLPGRKWWSLFLKRHPGISLRTPEHLPLSRVRACTSEALDRWYHDFDQFLEAHSLKDQAHLIWNADESGFQQTGKILAIRNARTVYGGTQDSKELITTICAASASGDTIPPMHIFPGVRFKSNPMDGCVYDAYMGHSPTGWIDTALFYGWLVNHFATKVTQRPVLLIVDGHSSHVDLEVAKFCRDNSIHLYCLPAHTSHLTQNGVVATMPHTRCGCH